MPRENDGLTDVEFPVFQQGWQVQQEKSLTVNLLAQKELIQMFDTLLTGYIASHVSRGPGHGAGLETNFPHGWSLHHLVSVRDVVEGEGRSVGVVQVVVPPVPHQVRDGGGRFTSQQARRRRPRRRIRVTGVTLRGD